MKNSIFISHATPDDNEFSVWLATKLELCGYNIWVDQNELHPSNDFWQKIESAIRNDAIKFIFVASKISIKRDGVIKELAVADRIRRENQSFITPVRIDDLPYNDFPIEILRLQTIDFYENWGTGLSQLLKSLEDEGIPRQEGYIDSKNLVDRWKQIFSVQETCYSQRHERYYSNLHEIYSPAYLYAYDLAVEPLLKRKRIPFKKTNGLILTFACNKCVSTWLATNVSYDKISTIEAADEHYSATIFGKNITDIDYHVGFLLNWNINNLFFSKGLYSYRPDVNSKKRVFYFQAQTKHKSRTAKRPKQLSGNYLGKIWHFGLSAYCVKMPASGMLFRWHLVFSDDKGHLLPQFSQIKCRRSKGKRFFNKDWKDLLLTAIDYLADNSEFMCYTSCCHDSEIRIKTEPFVFFSDVGYVETNNIVAEDTGSSPEDIDEF